MISTPMNPTMTANQRRQPTFSPMNTGAMAVSRIGLANRIEVAVASGRLPMPTR